MSRYGIHSDAQRIYETVAAGGAVIAPNDIGYGVIASAPETLLRLFRAKRRAAYKRNAMAGNYELHREVHHLGRRSSTMIDFSTMEVIRMGSCYELISDIFANQFGINLPGFDALQREQPVTKRAGSRRCRPFRISEE